MLRPGVSSFVQLREAYHAHRVGVTVKDGMILESSVL